MITRIPFRTQMRAAAVELFTTYAADTGVKLQVYRARPRAINPPTAFVDTIRETYLYTNVTWRLRSPILEAVLIHGLFDSGEAVDNADAFADAFLNWVTDRYHAAGSNTIIAITQVTDEATYVPDWLRAEEQRTYYASRIFMEGTAGG